MPQPVHFIPMARTSASVMRKVHASGLLAISFLISNTLLFLGACNRSSSLDDTDAADGAPVLAYGTKVGFGQGSGSERYRESGWSKTEEKFTWTEGTVAVLKMKVPATSDSVTLKMRLAGLVKEPALHFQPVDVEINGQRMADWQVSDVAEFSVAIPHDITKKGSEVTVTLKIVNANSRK